ncbi:hypothetical protein ACXPWS_26935 [Mycobacterium sp. BMJ-28]
MRNGKRAPLWLWLIAIASVGLLVVAVVGRGDGPTLSAIPADNSMHDDEARTVAEKTVLAWARERNAGRFENLQELTCSDPPQSWVSRQLDHAREGISLEPWKITALTGFSRRGQSWTINGLSPDHGGMFTLHIENGRLRVCEMGPVPVPSS